MPFVRRRLLLAPALLLIILFLFVPIGVIIITSFWIFTGVGFKPGFVLDNYAQIFASSLHFQITLITIRIAAITTFLSLILGYPIAYYMATYIKKDVYRLMLVLLLLMPFWTDWTVRTMSWIPILGLEGLLNTILLSLGIIHERSGAFLFSDFAVIFAMVQSYILFMVAPISLALGQIDRSLIHAASTLGASSRQVFREIILPLTKSGIVMGSVFVFVLSMADFATPKFVGGTVVTLGLDIINQLAALNLPLAAALAVFMTVIIFAIIMLMLRIVDVKKMVF